MGYSNMINELKRRKITPVFFIDNLSLKRSPLNCIKSTLILRKKLAAVDDYCKVVQKKDWGPHEKYDLFVEKLSKKFPSILFFDPRSLICEDSHCSLFREGKLLYSDINHYSIYGSLIVVDSFIKKLKEKGFEKNK